MLLKGNGLWLIVLADFKSYPWLAEIVPLTDLSTIFPLPVNFIIQFME